MRAAKFRKKISAVITLTRERGPGRGRSGGMRSLARPWRRGSVNSAGRRKGEGRRSAPAMWAAAALAVVCGLLGAGPAGTAAARTAPATAAHTGAHPVSERVGTAPAAVRGAHRIGALAASARIHVDVMLAPRNKAALQDYATNVSSPGNSLYRHYLTVGQFAARFGPTPAGIRAVESSLRKAGLRPGRLASDHVTLPVTATAGQFARAFSTGFQRYRLPGGRIAFANTRAPMFPAAAARYVQAVVGLDDLSLPQPLGLATPAGNRALPAGPRALRQSPHVVTGGPQPCTAAVNAASAQGAYTADQLASAYDFSALYAAGDEGAGVTIAVVSYQPNLTSDIAAYQSCYGTDTTVNYMEVDGGPGGFGEPAAGYGESALDIEDLIGLAPMATIDVYQGSLSTAGASTFFVDDITAVVDSSAQVASMSYGTCEDSDDLAAEGTLFEQAATEGQSWFTAAGDSGSDNCADDSVDVLDPASQPYVTGVGGTSLTSISPPTQTVWNESAIQGGAGGGGISAYWAMPAYQSSARASLNVINADSSGSPCGAPSGSYCREVPDVSASADPYHGYLIYWGGSWQAIGGTSAATPTWAAFTALTDASAACGGTPIGFANPVLYQAAAENYSADFTDITTGNNDYTPSGYTGGLYPAGPGYDMASGLGTPNGGALAQALCTPLAVTVTSPGSQTATVGAPVASLQITATDSGGGALTFAAAGLPPGLSISSTGLISGTPITAGAYPVTVTATDPANVSGSVAFTITVDPGTPVVSWTNPASIVFGTVLGSAQLDATASVPGTFTYSPAAGTLLAPGSGQTLKVTFTPADSTDYTTAAATAAISVTSQPCITGTSTGALTIGAGKAGCITGGTQTGAVSVTSGGAFYVNGGSVTGSLSVNGATAVWLCNVKITGSVSIAGSSGPVLVGGSGCANTISGAVSLTSNAGEVTFIGNTVSGSLTITGNSGLVLVGGSGVKNSVSGAVSITGNTGGLTYLGNTVGGSLTITGNSGPFDYVAADNTTNGKVTVSDNT
jgi:hypothetical protein